MKKLTLLFVLLSVAITALAGNAPRAIAPEDVFGDEFYIYQRSTHGSAVNPVTHTFMVPQNGGLEITGWDGLSFAYIKNIVYGSEIEFGDYWVEAFGDQEGGFMVEMGQVIAVRNLNGSRNRCKAVLAWGTIHYEASTQQTSFTPNNEVSEAHYTADGNTIHLEGSSGPVAAEAQDDFSYDAEGLGIVWEDEDGDVIEWAGYCEWGTEFDSSPYVIDWQPEGELKTYTRTSNCIHFSDYSKASGNAYTFSTETLSGEGQIVFANDGHTVYMKDPLISKVYNTWITGTLNEDGTIMTFDIPQYLYVNSSDYTYFRIFAASCYVVTQNSNRSNDYLKIEQAYGFTSITYRIEGNTISVENTSCDLDAAYPNNFNASGLLIYDSNTGEGAIECDIVYTLKSDGPDEPEQTEAPVIRGYDSEDIQAHIVEIVPSEPSTIYYMVQYPNGSSSTWSEYIDELCFTEDGRYKIEAYAVAENKLPSEHVYYEFTISPVTGISELTDGKQITGVRYYNAIGQEMNEINGLTIVVTTFSDGTTSTVKVVK